MSVDGNVRERERNEKRALKVVGICFLGLAAYIAYESATDLWSKRPSEHSIPGIILASVSLVVIHSFRVRSKEWGTRSAVRQ
jgi:hypothetical protein